MTAKITEEQLKDSIARLNQKIDESIEEGWWGDNMPTWLGGDPKAATPAEQPIKFAKTTRNYKLAQDAITALYKAAQVDLNADEIVKSRFGLPTLPPFEQWDGTMPRGKGSDFLTKYLLSRQASQDAVTADASNVEQSKEIVARDKRIEQTVDELLDALEELDKLLPDVKVSPVTTPAVQATDLAPKNETLAESMTRLKNLLSERVDINNPGAYKMPVPVDAPAQSTSGEEANKELSLTAQIQALVTKIKTLLEALQKDDPEPDAGSASATAIESANKLLQSAEEYLKTTKEPEADPTAGDSPDADAQAAADAIDPGKTMPASTPTTAPPAISAPAADATKVANKTPQEYTVKPGDNLTKIAKELGLKSWRELYDLNKDQIKDPNLIYPNQKLKIPAAPNTPAQPDQNKGKELSPQDKAALGIKTGGDFTKPTPGSHLDVSDPRIKALQAKADADPNGVNMRTTIREDQTIARIIDLARR